MERDRSADCHTHLAARHGRPAKLKKALPGNAGNARCKDKAFDLIRHSVIWKRARSIFCGCLENGTVCTNIFLRRLHNFCVDMSIGCRGRCYRKNAGRVIKFKEKRGISWDEHQKDSGARTSPELHAYYEMLWHLGGSQTDMASLRAEDVDWPNQTISYARMKTGSQAMIHFGDAVANILQSRPAKGYLFPQIVCWKESDRAKAFSRRCTLVGVSGVSLHSYRYAWAERAKTCGYPERFAMENLGHGSNAVTRAYAKKAKVLLPSLEEYEQKIVPLTITSAKETAASVPMKEAL
jgi:hypothetical protein